VSQRNQSLFFIVCLLVGCGDQPVREAVDLSRTGVVIDRTVRFKHVASYAFGFAFSPSVAKNGQWNVGNFERDTHAIWAEFNPAVDVSIIDVNGVIAIRTSGDVSHSNGWTLTNSGSGGEEPASVYQFISFRPDPDQLYHLRVVVVRSAANSSKLRPVFFIEEPTAMP
jgi:hypothetical protein